MPVWSVNNLACLTGNLIDYFFEPGYHQIWSTLSHFNTLWRSHDINTATNTDSNAFLTSIFDMAIAITIILRIFISLLYMSFLLWNNKRITNKYNALLVLQIKCVRELSLDGNFPSFHYNSLHNDVKQIWALLYAPSPLSFVIKSKVSDMNTLVDSL